MSMRNKFQEFKMKEEKKLLSIKGYRNVSTKSLIIVENTVKANEEVYNEEKRIMVEDIETLKTQMKDMGALSSLGEGVNIDSKPYRLTMFSNWEVDQTECW